jgi:hypothetical protein
LNEAISKTEDPSIATFENCLAVAKKVVEKN